MPATELLIQQKTIFHHFPDFEDFFNQAILAVEKGSLINSQEEEALFHLFAYCVYDRWKLNVHYNQPEVFFSKLWAGMAARFFTLQKRERLWNNIFAHIKLEIDKIIDLKTTEYTQQDNTQYQDSQRRLTGEFDRTIDTNSLEKGEHREAKRTVASEKPLQTSNLLTGNFGNLKDRAKWLSGEEIEDSGYIGIEKDKDGNPVLDSEGKPVKILNPNWNKKSTKGRNKDTSHKSDTEKSDSQTKDRGIIDKTVYTQQQPILIQQLSRIIPSYSLVESDLEEFTDFNHLFHTVWLDEGEFVFNTSTWTWDYITREEIQAKEAAKTGKIRLPKTKDPDQDLSFDEWEEIYNEQEKPVMPTWYLERIWRNKQRLEKKSNKDETDQARLEICDKLLDTFYWAPYWPNLDHFEEFMGSPPQFLMFHEDPNKPAKVIGFKEFKNEWRRKVKTAQRHRVRGTKPPQVFFVLLGPPGVGKSQICQDLAKTLKRPIQIINCAGIDDPGEFEGKRATLQSANYGKVMEAFIDRSFLAEVTIADLELELQEIKTRKEQEEYLDQEGKKQTRVITVPRKEITLTEWEEDRIEALEEEIKEWKEDNQERIKQGKKPKLTKKKAYHSRAPILLFDEVEKIKEQAALDVIGKITDRELNYSFMEKYFNFNLDLSEAIILLTANDLNRIAQFIKDRCKPVNIELLTWAQRKQILKGYGKKLCKEYEMTNLLPLLSERFLEMCITETWGIRGGINNLMATVDFLDELAADEVANQLTDLANFDELEETPLEDYLKREEGVIKLTYHLGGEERLLTITKRLGIQPNKDNPEVKEIITGINLDTDQPFVNDWPDEYWWGSEPVREV